MKKIIKSPTRVDLAGGTLDLWPLYNFIGQATTINVAIDIWTKAEVEARNDGIVKIRSNDLKKEWSFGSFSQMMSAFEPDLIFYQKVFERFVGQPKFTNALMQGFELTTASESPIGGGLGGSSSLLITILKAIYYLAKQELSQTPQLVHLAHNIESDFLRTPTGTQDYYPAVTGGLSLIEYSSYEIRQEVLPIENTPLLDHFLLVYTGRSHHSGLNNFEVLKSAVEGKSIVLDSLRRIRDISVAMTQAFQKQKWNELPYLFQQEFQARLQLTPAFSSPEIERLSEICLSSGALAVKICGAGGGGCVLVWVPPQKREKVVQVCQNEKFQCLNAQAIPPIPNKLDL